MKESYFPNWHVTGAQGPYRLAPNMMVVVPTSTHVSLTYGLTSADWVGRAITVAGAVGLVLLGLWTGARRFAAGNDDAVQPEETEGGAGDTEGQNGGDTGNDTGGDGAQESWWRGDVSDDDEPPDGLPDGDEPPDRKEPEPALP